MACLPLIAAGDVFTAIRGNDITRLKALTPAELAERDKSGVSPLLYGSALGSFEGRRILAKNI